MNFNLLKMDIWEINRIWLTNSWQKIQWQAQDNAPYLTWKLAQSINIEPWLITKTTKSIIIWPQKVPYAVVREFINNKNPWKRFYMKRAFEKSDKIVEEEFTKAINIVAKKIKWA